MAESQAAYAFDDDVDGSALDTGVWIPLSRDDVSFLVGDADVEAAADTDAPGTAEACRYVAGASGTMNRLHI